MARSLTLRAEFRPSEYDGDRGRKRNHLDKLPWMEGPPNVSSSVTHLDVESAGLCQVRNEMNTRGVIKEAKVETDYMYN